MAEDINRQDAIRAHDRCYGFQDALNEAAIKAGEVAIKTAVLINGGAAVSVLAFIGGLVGQGRLTVKQMADVSTSLLWFAVGVILAVAALAFSYFTNYWQVAHERSKILVWQHPYVVDGPTSRNRLFLRWIFHVLASVTGFLSLATFIYGVVDVSDSIIQLAEKAPSPGAL